MKPVEIKNKIVEYVVKRFKEHTNDKLIDSFYKEDKCEDLIGEILSDELDIYSHSPISERIMEVLKKNKVVIKIKAEFTDKNGVHYDETVDGIIMTFEDALDDGNFDDFWDNALEQAEKILDKKFPDSTGGEWGDTDLVDMRWLVNTKPRDSRIREGVKRVYHR